MSIFPIFYLWKQVTGSPGEPALQKSDDHEVEILGTVIQCAGHSWNEYIFRELSLDMAKFEPQVDLTALTGQIEKADRIMEDMVFDPDNLDSAVTDIELTTDSLTSEQNYRNQQSADLSIEIETLTESTEKLSKETIEQTTLAIKMNLMLRYDVSMENAAYIQELVEDGVINEDVAEAISGTMQEQAHADKIIAPKMDANSVTPCSSMSIAESLEDSAQEVQEAIEEARRERNPDYDTDEEENDDGNRNN